MPTAGHETPDHEDSRAEWEGNSANLDDDFVELARGAVLGNAGDVETEAVVAALVLAHELLHNPRFPLSQSPL